MKCPWCCLLTLLFPFATQCIAQSSVHAVSVGVPLAAVGAAPFFLATPLGTLGGSYSRGYAINISGQITGYSSPAGDASNLAAHAFIYTAGAMKDLGTLGLDDSYGFGINASGQVTGTAVAYVTMSKNRAFLYSGGHMTDLGTLSSVGSSEAAGINDSGQVIGLSDTAQGRTIFLYENGAMANFALTHAPPIGSPVGINASGQVAATAITVTIPTVNHPFLYGPSGTVDLGSLGGGDGAALAINNAGQVTGRSVNGSHESHAFLYSPPPSGSAPSAVGTMSDLGTLGGKNSIGRGINNLGQVTGDSTIPPFNSEYHAFLYTDGTMYDLNSRVVSGLDSGVTLTEAVAINDLGQIVANYCFDYLQYPVCNAYLLTPVPTPPTALAVEYYYAAWNHYFVTAFSDEIAALDSGAFGGVWKRTGQTFIVWSQAGSPGSPTCRYFSTAFAPKSTHFYSPFPNECGTLANNPSWHFEGVAFYLPLPDANWLCGKGTAPLYRLYNNGMGGAPNHRYTTSLALLDQMVAAGWTYEGNGSGKVFACVPN